MADFRRAPVRGHTAGSLAWALLYVAVMALGRLVVLPETGLALFWPAAGVAALWLLRGATRREVVLDGALLAAATALFFWHLGPPAALLLAGANLVQALVVRWALARAEGRSPTSSLRPRLERAADLLRLAAASLGAAVVGSALGTPASWALTGELSWSTTPVWVVRNACALYVLVAVVLALRGPGPDPDAPRLALTAEPRARAGLELAAVVLATTGLGSLVFGADQQLPVTYLVLVTSAWIGFRFVPGVGALHCLGFGTLAVVVTLLGWGPFAALPDPSVRAVALQLFAAVTTSLVLLLALGVAERAALARQLRLSESSATARARLLGAVTEALTDGLCVSDSWGHVVMANSAAATLGGADADGRHVHDPADVGLTRVDGSAVPPGELPHARALRGESVPATDVVRVDPLTGAETVLSVTAVPLHHGEPDEAGAEHPMAVVLLRDVTRERADSRVLQSFAGVVAHDLKNPLTGVLTWGEVARDQLAEARPGLAALGRDDTADAVLASLERIHGAATRMDRLIDDLLGYTVAGSAELNPTCLDLDALLVDVVRDLGLGGGDRGHDGPAPADDGTGGPLVQVGPLGRVRADEVLTRQLFANLLGNAVKYVAPGVRPHVRVTGQVVGEDLEVRVVDNGVGIPRADRGKVFDSFFRSAATGDYPGTGLGLAICRQAVTRHGGRIAAYDGPGTAAGPGGPGTTIVLTLPLDVATGAGAAPGGTAAVDSVALAAALPSEGSGHGDDPLAPSPLRPTD
ncbi:Signal transduction histidine kinase [Nocardioides scoriae]|uniref:Sensor-like histidine kinase SenX3 n=1 Tax=Nocardioides scoriae TaxID=642780 RepID=A0A1H1RKS3_9ACTN|nr:ATP-binding protein [Nocardioides scoriae]SDS36361.1 Signal transduction histidine kinase [Nocardioides scoriae]